MKKLPQNTYISFFSVGIIFYVIHYFHVKTNLYIFGLLFEKGTLPVRDIAVIYHLFAEGIFTPAFTRTSLAQLRSGWSSH